MKKYHKGKNSMKRRDFLKISSVFTGGFLFSSCAHLGRPSISRKPNFIIIFTDDQGYGDLGCYGSKNIRSPNIDKMAEEGMKFTDFYVTASCCTPSRASLLTGSYPARVGLPRVLFPKNTKKGFVNGKPIGLNPNELTISKMLKQQGYGTACIGKWHLGDHPNFMPNKHGFDYYFGLPYSNDMIPVLKKEYSPLPLMRNDNVLETNPDQTTLTKRYTEEALQFIEQNKDKPFFLYLAHSMPHRPCHASEPFMSRVNHENISKINESNRFTRDFIYPACIEEIDWSTGEILKQLRQLGIERDTLVVFTSDNGAKIPGGGNNGPLRGGKGQLFEGGYRVPCVMKWPRQIPAGTTCRELTTSLDILPTIANVVGFDLPKDRVIDGKNVLDVLEGQPDAASPHEAFFYFDWRTNSIAAVRSGKWKLFLNDNKLYNLHEDIGETSNVAAANPEVVKRLTKLANDFSEHMKHTKRPVGTL